jgi:hypothetical protein
MRKLMTAAIMVAALITTAGGTAYALLDQSGFAAPAASLLHFSAHLGHDGRALRPGHADVFTS